MNSSHLISGFVNRLVLFVLVLAGLYLSITSVTFAIASLEGGDGSDLELVVLGIVALVAVVSMSIGGHFLTKWSNAGWQVLATIAPLLAAFGAIAVQVTSWGAVLVAACAPCLLLLLHPAKIDHWARVVLGIDDGARLASVLGASGAVLLVVFDKVAFTPCPYTQLGLVIALLGAGGFIQARGFSSKGRATRGESLVNAPRHVADVPPAVATSAFFSLFSWSLCPVVIVLAFKQLAFLSSFGSAIGAVWVAILSLLALAGGAGVVALLATRASSSKPLRIAALIFLGILGTCTATITLAGEFLDGNAILAIRLLEFFSIPGTFMAMLGIQTPDVKGIAFHFWKGFMIVVGIVLLIAGIGFKISNGDTYFMYVYLAAFGVAAVAAAIPLASKQVVEVQAS
jgi:hypothetical protein